MRVLVPLLLVAAAFAGCAEVEPPVNGPTLDDLIVADGLNVSHAAFGFLTNAALPEAPQPGILYEDLGDGEDTVRVWYKPAYRGLPNAMSGLEPLAALPDVDGGGHGIAVFGSLAFTGGTSGPLNVVDISIPDQPKIIGTSEDTPVRDADTILFPDGRLILISTAGRGSMFATDVTDPTNATLIGTIETTSGNHNIAVVPGTPIAYNTGSGDHIDIVDWTVPESPVELGQFVNGNHCHDISFHIDRGADKYWAICAGYEQSEIWDILDPTAPRILVEIDYPSMDKGLPVVGGQLDDHGVPQDAGRQEVPCTSATVPVVGSGVSTPCSTSAAHPRSFSHLAMLNHDATVLIMGDETGGGASNQCDFYFEGSDGQTYSGPIGNLWFYDITDPKNPDLRGHVSPGYTDADMPGPDPSDVPPVDSGSCTAHFGKVIEDTDYLVMSFYSAGITLIDFQDLDNPRIVDRWDEGGDIWDVWFHQGYLFTGDMVRGMDVLALS